MPQRRPPSQQPANKPILAARKRPTTRATDAAAREEWQPGQTARAGAAPKDLLSLQRRFGNRAVQRLTQREPKLPVSPAKDGEERQAEKGAGRVTAGPAAAAGNGLLRASAAATRAASGLVQRRSALVSAKTTTRKFTGPRTADLDQDVAAVETAPKGQSYSRLEMVELFDAKQSHISDKAGAIGWFRIQSGKGAGEFIKGSKVIGGLEPGEEAPQEKGGQGQEMSGVDVSGNLVGEADAALVDIIRGATNEQDADKTKSLSAITNSADAQKGLAYAESGTWIGAGILGMAASLRDLTDKDKSGFDKLLASIGLLSGAAGVAGGVSQIVATATYDASATTQSATQQQAAATSGFMVGYGEMFGAITNGLKTIKGIVDLVKMVSAGKTDVGEYVKSGTDILSNGLQTAGGVLRTVRGFNEVLTHGGTATSQFGSVLPGLDIAIAAVGIIQNGYYLVVSAIEMRKMYARKQELEEKLQTHHGLEKEHIKGAGKRYRTEEAQNATTDQLIARATAKYNKLSVKKFGAKNDEERAKLAEQQVEVRTELDLLKKQKAEQDAKKGSGAFGDYSGQTADTLRERELASNTHIANKRRVTRQSVHIGAKLLQIGAAIATFVSGPGAPAAMALKLSALGIDGSLPFWRWLKEKGRDQAAKNRARGVEGGLANKIFNADKSKAAKSRQRHKDAVLILQMVGNLSKLIPGRADDKEQRLDKLRLVRPQAKRVEGYIQAAGCPPQKLYAANGNPPEQVKILVAELSRREL